MTKMAPQRIHTLRVRGGNKKYRALRLDQGNFSWPSEAISRKTRIIDVVYNAANNELVRTKTLVKNAIVVIDAAPFRQWYEAHFALPLGRKKGAKLTDAEEAVLNKKRSKKTEKKYKERQKDAKVEQGLTDQFMGGRVLAAISSRPGQCGRADLYFCNVATLGERKKKQQRNAEQTPIDAWLLDSRSRNTSLLFTNDDTCLQSHYNTQNC